MKRKTAFLALVFLLFTGPTGLPQEMAEEPKLYLPFYGVAYITQGHGGFSHDTCDKRVYKPDNCLFENRFALDIDVPTGTPVGAPADATVIGIVYNDNYRINRELHLQMSDYPDFVIVLLHLDSIEVELGQRVRRGDIVARSGWSGLQSKNHEHIHMHVAPLEGSGSFNARTTQFQVHMAPVNNRTHLATQAPRWYSFESGELNTSHVAVKLWRSTNRAPSPYEPITQFPSFGFLKSRKTGETFLFQNNTCYHINTDINSKQITRVDQRDLDRCAYGGSFPDGNGLSDGMVIRGRNGNIFLIENGLRRKLPMNPSEYLYYMGYWMEDVVHATDVDPNFDINIYPPGRPITPLVPQSHFVEENCPSKPILDYPAKGEYFPENSTVHFDWLPGNADSALFEIFQPQSDGTEKIFVWYYMGADKNKIGQMMGYTPPAGKYKWRVTDIARSGYCKVQSISSEERELNIGDKPWWVWPWLSESQSLNIAPEPFSFKVAQSYGRNEFAIRGLSVGQINIYDLSGKNVLSEDILEPQVLNWHTHTVANGVYLYVISGFDSEGNVVNSGIKKILVLN